jgi:hypothetical protein
VAELNSQMFHTKNKHMNNSEQKITTEPRHCRVYDVGSSIPSQAELVAETADAYCPNCEAYIVNERVTYEECCDTCGTDIEWHE